MRARPWLLASVGLNLFLAVSWWVAREPLEDAAVVIPAYRTELTVKTNTVIRRENFTWDQLESTNYATLIANLRKVGCPEQTIRDIVIADIDRIFERRRANEVVAPDYEWWKTAPDPAIVQASAAQAQALESERSRLLTSLLGSGWEKNSPASIALRAGISLTGPVLGDLPSAVKQEVLAAVARGQQRIDAYLAAQNQINQPPDPMEMARLRQQFLTQMVVILNPDAYQEFALRYSQGAQYLRQQMAGVDLTPDQFRTLYNAVSPVISQPVFYYGGSDSELLQQQRSLQAQEQLDIKQALGEQSYAAYNLEQDPVYRSSKALAEQVGIPATQLAPLYQINRATQAELDRIRNDSTLTDDEKVQALAQAQVAEQQSLQQLLGPDLFAKWLQSSSSTH